MSNSLVAVFFPSAGDCDSLVLVSVQPLGCSLHIKSLGGLLEAPLEAPLVNPCDVSGLPVCLLRGLVEESAVWGLEEFLAAATYDERADTGLEEVCLLRESEK